MRALFTFLIVLITSSAASPLNAAEFISIKPIMTSQKMVQILVAVADESKTLPNMVILNIRALSCDASTTNNTTAWASWRR